MKKLLITLTLILTYSLNAQVYQTYSQHFVKIEGDLQAFETVQAKYMQKVAQDAVDKGNIAFWAFLKREFFDSMNEEGRYNYLFVQSNTDVGTLLSDNNAWWNNVASVLSKEELKEVEELQGKFEWKSDMRMIFIDEGSIAKGLGSHIQFNFAKPKDLKGFISENINLWKPHFENTMAEIGMLNWGVGRVLEPIGTNWSTVQTWDMFDSLENLMKYRVGYTLPENIIEKSKMSEINPDGWNSSMIFESLSFAVSQE